MKQIEMKKNTLYTIATLLTLSLFFVACNDDDLVNGPAPKEGDCIKFSVGGKNSRTVYNESDPWQIDWLKDGTDKIRIYSAEARIGDVINNVCADYSVEPYETTVPDQTINGTTIDEYKSFNTGWLVPDQNLPGLQWGAAVKYNFYAVYPADDSKLAGYNYEKGIITFNYNSNQKCTLTGNSIPENGITVYTTNPDMSNAYMVAKASASKDKYSEENPIKLQFEPIMTTLDITVRGTNHSAVPVTITGVSVINEFAEGTEVLSNGKFNYDINVRTSNNQSGIQTTEDGVSTLTTYVNVIDDSGNVGKQLQSTEGLKVTVFLPPIALTSATTAIQVHYAANFDSEYGGNGVKKVQIPQNVDKCNKRRVKLPQIATPLSNNWITPLDDDIYVSQLSIPGTHDAATIDCSLNAGKCQGLTIQQQLDMGVRFFDLRPTGVNENLPIAHGITACNIDLKEIWETFNAFLKINKKEFIIVLMRWEEEYDKPSIINWFGKNSEKNFNNHMSQFVSSDTYKEYSLDADYVKNDVTVGELRGKILTIMRPNQGTDPDGYFADKAPKGMTFISGFPGSHANGTTQAYCKPEYFDYGNDQWGARTEWIVYCQNYYDVPSDKINDKITSVKTYLDLAKNQADVCSHVWVINHCSGYLGSNIGSGYANLANKLNPEIYEYVNKREEPGSLGIVLLDYVGRMRWENLFTEVDVYGDLLPQLIIDNNYKYYLKRKPKQQ